MVTAWRAVSSKEDVRDIRRPHLIGAVDDEVSEKVGILGMRGIGLGAFILAIQRLNAHETHQPANVPATDAVA